MLSTLTVSKPETFVLLNKPKFYNLNDVEETTEIPIKVTHMAS